MDRRQLVQKWPNRTLNRSALRAGAMVIVVAALSCSAPAMMHAQAAEFDLHAAIAAAQPGSTIHVPAGSYAGPVEITKPIVLEGEGMPIIQGAGDGDVVSINADDVTLRGFIVRGSGTSLDAEHAGITASGKRITLENNRVEDALFGIYLHNAPESVIRGNEVIGKDLDISRRGDGLKVWYSAHTLIENNHVHDSRDSVIWFSPDTTVRGNLMEHNRYGLHFMSTDDHLIEDNVLHHNSVGIYLMYGNNYRLVRNLLYDNRGPSGYGLGLKEINNGSFEGNRVVNNRVGVYTDMSPVNPDAKVEFARNMLAYNDAAIVMLPGTRNNVYHENVFLDNNEQIMVAGEGDILQNTWAVNSRGNYWSDYAGFDANQDGVGDLAYEQRSLYENLMDKRPSLRLFQLSPAAGALDLAAKAFPIFQPQPKMADPNPLVAPPALPPVRGVPQAPTLENALIALGMVVLACALIYAGTRSAFARRTRTPAAPISLGNGRIL